MELKYIIVRDRNDEEHGIVFPNEIIHKDVARIHSATDVRLVSAGFCILGYPVDVYGKSDSLRMDSRLEDAAILNKDFESPPQRHRTRSVDL